MIVCQVQLLSNTGNKLREPIIDDGLIHGISIVLIKGWRDHDVEIRLGRHSLEVASHLQVISMECTLIPLVVLGVVGAEHEYHNVGVALKCLLVLSFIPVRVVTLLHHSPATDT